MIYRPDSNFVSFPIPDKYIGAELEITVFPIDEILVAKPTDKNKKRTIGILEGKASFKETGDGKITVEEFFYLIDTHTFIWAISDAKKLSNHALEIITNYTLNFGKFNQLQFEVCN